MTTDILAGCTLVLIDIVLIAVWSRTELPKEIRK